MPRTEVVRALWAVWLVGCGGAAPVVDAVAEAEAVGAALDDLHAAAAAADGARYFGHFTTDAVFIGTDATERWTVPEFQAYAKPHFDQGKGWTYVARARHVTVAEGGTVAWFDEALHNEKYGAVRGSGALRRVDGRWKIAQYVLSFPVPNDVAGEVIDLIQAAR